MYLSEEIETYYKDDEGHFVELSIDDPYDRFRFTVGVSDRHGERDEKTIWVTPDALRELRDGIDRILKAVDSLESS